MNLPVPRAALAALVAGLVALPVAATEFKMTDKVGKGHVSASLLIDGRYIQPIVLADGRENRPREQSDAYFIADVKANSGNPWGLVKFAWVSFLSVHYRLEKLDGSWRDEGRLTPAIGKFGPHHGANVKLAGVGKYRYTLRIGPPDQGIERLVDRENGISWPEPFEVSWNFTYLGIGKKGVVGAAGGY
jgi:uncharacterized protein involved in high-affinity Fe2+ transport